MFKQILFFASFLCCLPLMDANSSKSVEILAVESMETDEFQLYLPLIQTSPIVVNGDFEDGASGWLQDSDRGRPLIVPASQLPSGITPHGGEWLAWLGDKQGGATLTTDGIEQQVTVPLCRVGEPHLEYWQWIDSDGPCGADFVNVWVQQPIDRYDVCGGTDSGGWQMKEYEIREYVGQTITLRLQLYSFSDFGSNLFLDDVAVTCR